MSTHMQREGPPTVSGKQTPGEGFGGGVYVGSSVARGRRRRSGAEPRRAPRQVPPRAAEHGQGPRLGAVPGGGGGGHICKPLVPTPRRLGTGAPQPRGGPESGASATALPKSLVSLPCDARSPQLPPAIGAQQAPDAPEFSDVKLSPDWTKEKGAWSAPFG